MNNSRTPLAELEPSRVCLIKPSALGDVVQTLPVLAGLRQRWPKAEISWVVQRGFTGLLAGHPQLDAVIPFERKIKGFSGIQAIGKLAKCLRQSRFDLVIDLQGLLRSGLMCLASGAPRRVGFANAREFAHLAYTDRIPVDTMEQSAVSRYWLVARALGCSGDPPPASVGISAEIRQRMSEKLASLPGTRLAIHAGAQWQTKRWPIEHFIEIARRAQREFQAGVILVGGPGEGQLAAAIARGVGPAVVNLAEQTNLLELAAVLEAADVVCSNDSGPMHLAAAVGTRVVGLYTCTSPVRAAPYGVGHRTVATTVHCASSYVKSCNSLICMGELTPRRVWPVVRMALMESASGRLRRAS